MAHGEWTGCWHAVQLQLSLAVDSIASDVQLSWTFVQCRAMRLALLDCAPEWRWRGESWRVSMQQCVHGIEQQHRQMTGPCIGLLLHCAPRAFSTPSSIPACVTAAAAGFDRCTTTNRAIYNQSLHIAQKGSLTHLGSVSHPSAPAAATSLLALLPLQQSPSLALDGPIQQHNRLHRIKTSASCLPTQPRQLSLADAPRAWLPVLLRLRLQTPRLPATTRPQPALPAAATPNNDASAAG